MRRALYSCLAFTLVFGLRPAAAQGPTLAVQGDHLAVNGGGKFLLFVSYFDAMRRARDGGDLDIDFAYFKSQGIDGIRIFPNWYIYECVEANKRQDDNALFGSDGTVANLGDARWAAFKRILDRAGANGLVVDVTFTRDTFYSSPGVPVSIPVPAYQSAILDVAGRLRDLGGYPHVLFDIQNEFDKGALTPGQASGIVAAVRQDYPSRITTVSRSGGALPTGNDLSVATYHDPRDVSPSPQSCAAPNNLQWFCPDKISAAVTSIRSGFVPAVKPIYYQEPMPFNDVCPNQDNDSTLGDARAAASNAKRFGVAAWTFHNRESFHLFSSTLKDTLINSGAIKTELDSLNGVVNCSTPANCPWGVTSPLRFPGGDYYGTLKSALAIWRPSTGTWWMRDIDPTVSPVNYQWGLLGDVPVPGDYDGDGKADLAIWRPGDGNWYIRYSSTNLTSGPAPYQWGLPDDVPVPADYDKDGKTDLAVWRPSGPSQGTWYIRFSATGYTTNQTIQFGLTSDRPLPGDYDGDGKADLAIWRPSNGTWYIRYASTGFTSGPAPYQWGLNGDTPVPADYDNDGTADLAVWRPSDGTWYIVKPGGGVATIHWGLPSDIPIPGDYDGDGRADAAVWRPSESNWYIDRVTGPPITIQWGLPSDTPMPGNGQPLRY